MSGLIPHIRQPVVNPKTGTATEQFYRWLSREVVASDQGQTLTNKTINLTDNSLTGTLAQFNAALSDANFASIAGVETLSNKGIDLTNNSLSGTVAQFNAALTDNDFATLTGAETLENKTLVAPAIGAATGTSATLTGVAHILNGTAIPAGGTAGAGYKLSSTSNFGVFFGSGAPALAAAKGSMYLRSDGSTTNDRAYINTDGGTTWTALITAA